MDSRHIETFRGKDGQYYFRVVADGPSQEIIAQSQGYVDLRDMMDTLEKYFPEWHLTVEPAQELTT